ncbi:hypothetical protein J3F83DRAFT_607268 [Trichoderma novae-zelandiae]
MSAVAIPYEMSAMRSRSPLWPHSTHADMFDPVNAPSTMVGPDFASILHPVSEPSVSPQSVPRTLHASTPKSMFGAEHRVLKKQREKVRRDSKVHARVHRASDTANHPFMQASLSAITSTMALPVYSTAGPTNISLLSEPTSTLSEPQYLPPYSPHMSEPAFTTQYQQHLPSNYSMSMDYQPTYATAGAYSIPHAPIQGQDGGMMYRIPAMHSNGGASSATSTGTGSPDSTSHVRVVQNRPKPRCWEHGCNGRQFSTFSNLLRHQREKSGQAAKATCPNCGAEFTRTTARNGHLMHDKCKQRRNT